MKKIIILILLLNIISVQADDDYPAEPSVKLEESEYGYGPPSPPVEKVSEELFQKAKKGKEDSFEVYYNIGYMAYRLGKYLEAIEYFKKAEIFIKDKIPFAPSSAHFYTYFAFSYEKIKNLKKAKQYYMKSNDPYYLHFIIARIFKDKKEYKKAEKEYLLAQSVGLYEMENCDPFKELAEMYYSANEYKLASKYISKYIECAEYEIESGGAGYLPSNTTHIEKAKKYKLLIENKSQN